MDRIFLFNFYKKGESIMFSIVSTGGHTAYNLQHFVVDELLDLQDLPIDIHAGSTAFVIETSTYYMLDNKKEWKTVNLGSSGGGASPTTVVYEGGVLT